MAGSADPLLPLDRERLRQALALAETSFGLSDPNPRVGCVIGRPDGVVLGQGATQAHGGPHAEVMALRDAASQGHSVSGATAWVTLEPCSHHGRTPPCCDALVQAGIARVVVGATDPFPEVNGAGIRRLRGSGVQVVLADRDTQEACREVNIGFFSRFERGRPWVRVKAAVSLDGRTALADGRSQWVTGAEARRDGHEWRRRAGAVLTGVGTVLADDPQLDVRLVQTARQPMRIVLDSHWRTPPGSRLLRSAGGPVVIAGVGPSGKAASPLLEAGAELLALPAEAGRVSLGALLTTLASRGVNELHVEAGSTLNGALLAGGWVDEWLIYLAPKLLGPGRPMAELPLDAGRLSLSDAPGWRFIETSCVGTDLRLRLRPASAKPVEPAQPL